MDDVADVDFNSVDVVFIKLIFKRLNLIILSCKLHNVHSTEPIHHGRPTSRPEGHRGDLLALLLWRRVLG